MSERPKGTKHRNNLRVKAEALLQNLAPSKSTAQTTEILMHELMVHKVELEIQNEELRRSNNSIEDSRDRYADFYEFAPVGYITVSRDGLILEINLTGCVMLGIERFRIISRRLSNYVAPYEKDRWHRLFLNVMEHSETEKHTFDLEMMRADGSIFYAYLTCIKYQKLESSAELRIALTDISKLKPAVRLLP